MNQKNISRNRKVIRKRRSRRRSPKIIRKKSKRKSYYPISNIVVGSIVYSVIISTILYGINLDKEKTNNGDIEKKNESLKNIIDKTGMRVLGEITIVDEKKMTKTLKDTILNLKYNYNDIFTQKVKKQNETIDIVHLTELEKQILQCEDETVVIWHKNKLLYNQFLFTAIRINMYRTYTVYFPQFYGIFKNDDDDDYYAMMENCGKMLTQPVIDSVKFEITIGEIVLDLLCKIDITDAKYRNVCIKQIDYDRIYKIHDKYFHFDSRIIPIRIDLDAVEDYTNSKDLPSNLPFFKWGFFDFNTKNTFNENFNKFYKIFIKCLITEKQKDNIVENKKHKIFVLPDKIIKHIKFDV